MIGILALGVGSCGRSAKSQLTDDIGQRTAIQIPASIRAEHQAIHEALERASRDSGQVGAAARELAEVLGPHFVREEQIALPPLGLLAPLASDTPISATVRAEVQAMSDSLEAELPKMLEEHQRIRTAVGKLREAARAAKAVEGERLADQLSLHALTEEEILYPAAVLVGDLIRARQGK